MLQILKGSKMKLIQFDNIDGFDKVGVNKIFLSVFTFEELQKTLECAFVVNENNIIINTKNYFFELLIINNKINIVCSRNSNLNSSSKTISKKFFLKLLSQSKIEFPKEIQIDK
jgi:hypothetical protein